MKPGSGNKPDRQDDPTIHVKILDPETGQLKAVPPIPLNLVPRGTVAVVSSESRDSLDRYALEGAIAAATRKTGKTFVPYPGGLFTTVEPTSQHLDTCLRERPRNHLTPFLEAAKHGGLSTYLAVGQAPWKLPHRPGKPTIVVIGDDFDNSKGPPDFHKASLRRLLAAAPMIMMQSAAAVEMPYQAAADTAVHYKHLIAVIETQPVREEAWLRLIMKANPRQNSIFFVTPDLDATRRHCLAAGYTMPQTVGDIRDERTYS